LFIFYLKQKLQCFIEFVFKFLLLGAIITLKSTMVMLKILQKYCPLNFGHVPKETLHKNIFLVYLYSSWKTASCGLGYKRTGETKATWTEKTSNGHQDLYQSIYTLYTYDWEPVCM